MRRLERELGVELFDRSGRTVRPTAAAEAVLPHLRASLAARDRAREAAAEVTGLLRGRVAVGMVTACGAVDLPPMLAEFHRRHPGVEIVLREDTSSALQDEVRAGRLDLAWVALAGGPTPGLARRVLTDEAVVGAVAPGHRLAGAGGVDVADLRDEPLVAMPTGTGLRTALDAACAVHGFRPTIAFEAMAPPMLADLAAAGLGLAVLPESVVAENGDRLRRVDLRDPAPRGSIELVWRADGPSAPAARALVAHACRALSADEVPTD